MVGKADPLRLNVPLLGKDGVPTREFALFLNEVWRKVIAPDPDIPEFPEDMARYGLVGHWLKGQRGNVVNLDYAASISPVLDDGNIFNIAVMTGDMAIGDPVGMPDHIGQEILIVIRQDASGTRIPSFGPAYMFEYQFNPIYSTNPNAIDAVVGTIVSATEILCSYINDFG